MAGTIATGLETPWGLAFLPDGSALVGERDTGRIMHVRAGARPVSVGTVPGVVSNGAIRGEAGLLGLALSPRFATDHLLYVYLSTGADNRIVRMTYASGRLGRPAAIVTGIPRGLHHNGGRLVFGPDGMLYASTGESGVPALSQNLSSLGGKILRMTPDGKPAAGNPFRGSLVWSYGHRNVEGLAFDAAGRLWATEFGDKAYDELNLVLPGHNYGWPATQGRTSNPRYTSPKAQWHTDDAGPSGIAIAGSVAWIGALTGHRLWRVPLRGPAAGTPVAFLVDTYGRLRTAAVAPDGSLWVTTSNTDGRGTPRSGDDRILRLVVT
jgi:glucose/arabinose dehydrogenase